MENGCKQRIQAMEAGNLPQNSVISTDGVGMNDHLSNSSLLKQEQNGGSKTSNSIFPISTFQTRLRQKMKDSSTLLVLIPTFCIFLSFLGTYIAKYPLFVVDYGNEKLFGNLGIKDGFSYAFTLGFFLGKFPSYKYIPSIERKERFNILLVLYSATSVFMTACLPLHKPPFFAALLKTMGVFVGSLFGSAIFGTEMLYLEGRSHGDIFLAAFNCVITFGPSIARATGKMFLHQLPGQWMPLALVLFYAPVVAFTLVCLDAMPNPNDRDRQSMGERTVMTASQKSLFLRKHGVGLIPLFLGYAFSTGFRFLRDFFALEVYRDLLQREPEPFDYVMADWVGGLVSIVLVVGLSRVANNALAMMLLHVMIVSAALIMGVSVVLFSRGTISPQVFIVLVGLGVTLSMTPFSGSLFDRVIACTRTKGTAIFLILIADGCGYIGVFLCLFYKTTSETTIIPSASGEAISSSYSKLFLNGCYAFSAILSVTGLLSATYWSMVAQKSAKGFELPWQGRTHRE
mmetsp:Transcript_13721/g.20905  ORF Transcript_13721/g.20905 Transcript_13721/m.20905 type:complete len:514 (+) Transcript_13721:82-1623(+)|eukprot:CAMPEP_0178903570 /NCGR_PEP_ID=MMETSP0786-20121207/5227_1 /TAXON_ID=186022 /ORGANISM="Thalassionema frauenfeldii, Strain CCMP 1798" /LENGTH=513 /DNA_ID=CAMNT_0020574949 /DNA_START=11 /DNA_END=1555 /DNA_ORIENTATION=+